MHKPTFFVNPIQPNPTQVNWVVDIGEASEVLGKVLRAYNFKNLDELFPEENTTTEFMCRVGKASTDRLGMCAVVYWKCSSDGLFPIPPPPFR